MIMYKVIRKIIDPKEIKDGKTVFKSNNLNDALEAFNAICNFGKDSEKGYLYTGLVKCDESSVEQIKCNIKVLE